MDDALRDDLPTEHDDDKETLRRMSADRLLFKQAQKKQKLIEAREVMQTILGRPMLESIDDFYKELGHGVTLCDAINKISMKHWGKKVLREKTIKRDTSDCVNDFHRSINNFALVQKICTKWEIPVSFTGGFSVNSVCDKSILDMALGISALKVMWETGKPPMADPKKTKKRKNLDPVKKWPTVNTGPETAASRSSAAAAAAAVIANSPAVRFLKSQHAANKESPYKDAVMGGSTPKRQGVHHQELSQSQHKRRKMNSKKSPGCALRIAAMGMASTGLLGLITGGGSQTQTKSPAPPPPMRTASLATPSPNTLQTLNQRTRELSMVNRIQTQCSVKLKRTNGHLQQENESLRDDMSEQRKLVEQLENRVRMLQENQSCEDGDETEKDVSKEGKNENILRKTVEQLRAQVRLLQSEANEKKNMESGNAEATINVSSDIRNESFVALQEELSQAKKDVVDLKDKLETLQQHSSNDTMTHQDAIKQVYENAKSARLACTNVSDSVRDAFSTLSSDWTDVGNELVLQLKQKSATEGKKRKDLVEGYQREAEQRRKLFNKLQQMRGNIRVICRVRPLLKHELNRGEIQNEAPIKLVSSSALAVITEKKAGMSNRQEKLKRRSQSKVFNFSRVFGPDSVNSQVYQDIQPLVTSALDGFHCCIFAYGQTGSGKTYTMEGPESDRGVTFRTMHDLFDIIKQREGTHQYILKCSMVEIYNENIRDLLGNDSKIKCAVRHGSDGAYLDGAVSMDVASTNEVHSLIAKGNTQRVTKATNANEHSSRSHSVLMINIKGKQDGGAGKGEIKGRLVLVDLAGSERCSKTNASGDRLTEAKHINKSLSALGDVIGALTAKQQHVPFRNSQLTFLLQDSLGKDNKCLMFAQVSPSITDVGESLCTLNFASRVQKVELGAAKSSRKAGAQLEKIQELETTCATYKKDMMEQRSCLKRMRKNLEESENKIEVDAKATAKRINKLKEMHEQKIASLQSSIAKAEATLQRKDQMIRSESSKAECVEKDLVSKHKAEVEELKKKLQKRNSSSSEQVALFEEEHQIKDQQIRSLKRQQNDSKKLIASLEDQIVKIRELHKSKMDKMRMQLKRQQGVDLSKNIERDPPRRSRRVLPPLPEDNDEIDDENVPQNSMTEQGSDEIDLNLESKHLKTTSSKSREMMLREFQQQRRGSPAKNMVVGEKRQRMTESNSSPSGVRRHPSKRRQLLRNPAVKKLSSKSDKHLTTSMSGTSLGSAARVRTNSKSSSSRRSGNGGATRVRTGTRKTRSTRWH